MLTAASAPKTLTEHMQVFMSRYARLEDVAEEYPGQGFSVSTTYSIMKILVDLHAQPTITHSDYARVRDTIYNRFPELGRNQVRILVISSFGFRSKKDFKSAWVPVNNQDTGTILNKAMTMNIFQVLFIHMVKNGLINSPAEVTIPELRRYANPEFIAFIKETFNTETAGTNKSHTNVQSRLREIEDKILSNVDIVLTSEEQQFAATYAISIDGTKLSTTLNDFDNHCMKLGVNPTNKLFNLQFMFIRAKKLGKTIERRVTADAWRVRNDLPPKAGNKIIATQLKRIEALLTMHRYSGKITHFSK
jgi:hypothetical protein